MSKINVGDRVRIATHAKEASIKLGRYTDQIITVASVQKTEEGETMVICMWDEGTYGTVERNPPFHENDLELV